MATRVASELQGIRLGTPLKFLGEPRKEGEQVIYNDQQLAWAGRGIAAVTSLKWPFSMTQSMHVVSRGCQQGLGKERGPFWPGSLWMVTRSWCQRPGVCHPSDNSGKRGWWPPSTWVRKQVHLQPTGPPRTGLCSSGKEPGSSQSTPWPGYISTHGHRPSRSVFLTLSRSPQHETGPDPGCGSARSLDPG